LENQTLQSLVEEIENKKTDPEIILLEKMLTERRAKIKQQKNEM